MSDTGFLCCTVRFGSIRIFSIVGAGIKALFRLFPSASLLVAHLGLNPVRVS